MGSLAALTNAYNLNCTGQSVSAVGYFKVGVCSKKMSATWPPETAFWREIAEILAMHRRLSRMRTQLGI